jgi:hypothetical protein
VQKINWVQSTLLLATILMGGFPILLIQFEGVATNQGDSITTNQSDSQISPAEFLRLFKRRKPPLGGRAPLCMATPGLSTLEVIWNSNPLFLWSGKASRIKVFSVDNQEVMWDEGVAETDRNISYRGKPLQPGKTYTWLLFDINNQPLSKPDGSPDYISFKFMDDENRVRIKTELTNLENQLRTAGNTNEQIVLKKAYYFAQQELWSDALQTIFSTPNQSNELTELAKKMISHLCGL